jgi:hypothetical protein
MRNILILSLSLLVVGFMITRNGAAEAASKYATTQFVEDSIRAVTQSVIQPLAARVGVLEEDVSSLDSRVDQLEAGDSGSSAVTDRGFFFDTSPQNRVLSLIDTDDGTTIATYSGALSPGLANCDGTRVFLHGPGQRAPSFQLIDTSDGHVISTFEAPPSVTGSLIADVAEFSCPVLNKAVNPALVKDRALVVWAMFGDAGSGSAALLVDTNTGAIVATYERGLTLGGAFDCTGKFANLPNIGLIDTVTGAIIQSAPSSAFFTFVCASQS